VAYCRSKVFKYVNIFVYIGDDMVQVQLRVPEQTVKEIDEWVSLGKFRSRSDAVKTIIALYEERVRTMDFFRMLVKRSREAEEKPEILIPLDETGD
jgi:Arc/MetJ-type ribon-helix-helix transcriptional regulator